MFIPTMTAIASNISFLSGLLLVVGLALMAAEFLTPGFGFFGISGITLLVIFVIAVAETPLQLLVLLILLFLLLAIMFMITVTIVSRKKLPKSLRLDDTIGDSAAVSAEVDKDLVGKSGKAVTTLRPCGRAEIDGRIYEVMTDGEFVDAETKITVIRREENGRIFVRVEKQKRI